MGQSGDLATEIVDMMIIQAQFEILANLVRRASEMTKRGIDILA